MNITDFSGKPLITVLTSEDFEKLSADYIAPQSSDENSYLVIECPDTKDAQYLEKVKIYLASDHFKRKVKVLDSSQNAINDEITKPKLININSANYDLNLVNGDDVTCLISQNSTTFKFNFDYHRGDVVATMTLVNTTASQVEFKYTYDSNVFSNCISISTAGSSTDLTIPAYSAIRYKVIETLNLLYMIREY